MFEGTIHPPQYRPVELGFLVGILGIEVFKHHIPDLCWKEPRAPWAGGRALVVRSIHPFINSLYAFDIHVIEGLGCVLFALLWCKASLVRGDEA